MDNLTIRYIDKIYNHLIEINNTLKLHNLLFLIQWLVLIYLVFK